MERLTYDFVGRNNCWEVKGADNYLCKDVCKNQGDNGCEGCPIREAIDRLAAYENTGLMPEEVMVLCSMSERAKMADLLRLEEDQIIGPIDNLRKLAQAEKDRRLVVLPCKVGGTVYATFSLCGDYLRERDKPYPCEVVFIGISNEPFMHIQFENGRVFPVGFEKIGKTVFTTREAAEAALKGREG